ncbi:MAG: S-layer homology domain-containing protein [Candidatus Peribacteraceae bacterium]|nr:S-layer homology domain-containing protein [Candidatus Peribacteraceae bacterium]MDD5075292.1 S-layer homology domain-containing protein [Candidatus Peribacteraceae bacterium]
MFRSHRWFLALALCVLPLSAHAGFFADVEDDHPYAASIETLRQMGIVAGFERPGERRVFWPDQSVTRAEFTKMVIMARFPQTMIDGCEEDEGALKKYGLAMNLWDVPADAWYTPYLCVAWTRSIVTGYGNGTFGADRVITLAEAAKILSVGFDLTNAVMPDLQTIGDEWYRPYLELLGAAKAIPPSVSGVTHVLDRGEVAEMIARLLHAAEKTATTISLDATDVTNTVKWVSYKRPDLRFSLEYPSSWTKPHELPGGAFDRDRLPALRSDWKIFIGPQRDCLGGSLCVERDFSLSSFPRTTLNHALEDLNASHTVTLLSDETVDETRTILFKEEGVCPLRSAFIVTHDRFFRFSLHCGSTLHDPVNAFLRLLARLKLS